MERTERERDGREGRERERDERGKEGERLSLDFGGQTKVTRDFEFPLQRKTINRHAETLTHVQVFFI